MAHENDQKSQKKVEKLEEIFIWRSEKKQEEIAVDFGQALI